MRNSLVVAIALLLCGAIGATRGATTLFKGRPSIRISEGGVERLPEQLPRERSINP